MRSRSCEMAGFALRVGTIQQLLERFVNKGAAQYRFVRYAREEHTRNRIYSDLGQFLPKTRWQRYALLFGSDDELPASEKSLTTRSPRTRRSLEETARSARRTSRTVGGLGPRDAAAADGCSRANVEPVCDALVGSERRLPPTFGGRSNRRIMRCKLVVAEVLIDFQSASACRKCCERTGSWRDHDLICERA